MRYPILGTGRGRIPALILVPDEGPGRVFTPRLDTSAGRLVSAGDAPAREGRTAPRCAASLERLRVCGERARFDCGRQRFDPEAGNLDPFQVVSARPGTFIGGGRAAESAVPSDGRFVYASNRGHDSIATLAVDRHRGA
jgi:6-phosphogluconolactonase